MKIINSAAVALWLLLGNAATANSDLDRYDSNGVQLAHTKIHHARSTWGESGETNQPSSDSGYAINSTTSHAVYRTETSPNQLFSIPLKGGVETSLMTSLGAEHSASSFKITHDGQSVVFITYNKLDKKKRMYLAPITGGKATLLIDPDKHGSPSHNFEISSDDKFLVVVVSKENPNPKWQKYQPVYRVPLTGGSAKQITRVGDYETNYLHLSPDNRSVVFLSDRERIKEFQLYSVPSKGGQIVQLNAIAGNKGEITGPQFGVSSRSRLGFAITEDSQRVVFSSNNKGDSIYNLFSVPISGGKPIKLNQPKDKTITSYGVSNANRWEISTNGKRVIYLDGASHIHGQTVSLFSAPISGGGATLHSQDSQTGVRLAVLDFQKRPNTDDFLLFVDNHIYRASADVSEPVFLSTLPTCSLPISYGKNSLIAINKCEKKNSTLDILNFGDASDMSKMRSMVSNFTSIIGALVTPDKQHIIFQGEINNVTGLYHFDIKKEKLHEFTPPKLNIETYAVSSFISTDSNYILFKGAYEDDYRVKLYSYRIND